LIGWCDLSKEGRVLIRFRVAWIAALCLSINPCAYSDDTYPSKPIRIVVPYPAGSSGDVRTRQLAPLLTQRLKQPIIIDNRPGAAANIGTELVAKSAPDGYTILYINNSTVCVNPHVYKDATFNPVKDLVPLIVTIKTANILVVNSDSSMRSVKDLIAQAKGRPGQMTYGTSGPGAPQHLMGERLKRMTGIDISPIPYKGESLTLTDLMGGQIDMAFGSPPATMPLIIGGKLRPLAVTSAKRMSNLPNIPTLAESGMPGYEELVWVGYAVAAGTPASIVEKLNQAFRGAMLTPEIRNAVNEMGAELVAGSSEQAAQLMRIDYERYGKIVKELNLKAD
jgi:tripartite-type tricarboxylate transporter receptor subunit TctC